MLFCFFNLYAEYIKRNPGLDEAQAEIKIARRNINNLRYANDTILWQKMKNFDEIDESEFSSPLDENERREWKSWFKAQHSES